jgi:hypothetical protein
VSDSRWAVHGLGRWQVAAGSRRPVNKALDFKKAWSMSGRARPVAPGGPVSVPAAELLYINVKPLQSANRYRRLYRRSRWVASLTSTRRKKRRNEMEKPKRSYYLPGKLVAAFDKECSKSGYVKEKVVAAAMLSFLDSNPETRSRMFEKLDTFLRAKK